MVERNQCKRANVTGYGTPRVSNRYIFNNDDNLWKFEVND